MSETDYKQRHNKGWDNLKKLKKGDPSPNPKGRPKKELCIPEILREIRDLPFDKKRTYLRTMCENVWSKAARGNPWACEFVADRMEGKAVERVLTRDADRDELIFE
jgi:hypothetical protein